MTFKMNDLTDVVVRLDKWMWASRFYRTRSIAKTAIQAGKVNYNGHKCKPGKIVEIGAVVTFKQGYDMKEVVVCKLSDQRRKADDLFMRHSISHIYESYQSIKLRQLYETRCTSKTWQLIAGI